MKPKEPSDQAGKLAPTVRLNTIYVPREAEIGADQAIYGDLVGRASGIEALQRVLLEIVSCVLKPVFDGRLEFSTTQCEEPGAPDRIGVAIVARSLGPGGARLMKEAAKLAHSALERLQHVSYESAQQPDLFYSGHVSGEDFADWPAPHVQAAVLTMSLAASRGDLTVEVLGGERKPLEFQCESKPSQNVGKVSIEALVSRLDVNATTVVFCGRVNGGDASARTALAKVSTFPTRIATHRELCRLAHSCGDQELCLVEMNVLQDGLKWVFLMESWKPLTSPDHLELQA